MDFLVIFFGSLFILFDMALLKKKARAIYEAIFYFPLWEIGVAAFLLFLSALASGEKGAAILQVIFVLLVCVYVLRRREFFAFITTEDGADVWADERLDLALSTFSIAGLWMLAIVVVSLIVQGLFSLNPKYDDELTGTLILSQVSVIILLVLIYRAVRRYKSLKFFEVLGLETKGLGPLKIWVLPALFALVYAVIGSLILDARPIQPVTPLQELLNSASSLGVVLFFVGTAVLSAPFFEEVIFRGFLFYVLRPFMGVIFTVLLVALLFGVMHVDQYWGDWAAIVVVGLFGLTLTVLRAWTGSSVPGMVAHYVYNASLIIIPTVMVIVANPIYFDYQMNYYRLTDVQKEERLMASITQNPQFGDSYNDLAWLYSDQSMKLDRALELINRALELEPRNYAFLDTKAEVLFKMGRVEEAIAIEKDLIKKYPKDSYLQKQLKKFEEEAGEIRRLKSKEI